MEESRKQFETWMKQHKGDVEKYVRTGMAGMYKNPVTHKQWMAWQASRAAIELDIDWPEANDDTWKDGDEGLYARGHEDGKDKVVVAVRNAIRAAGLKIKGE